MKRVDAECRDADPGGVDPDPRDKKKGSGLNLHESLDPERHAKNGTRIRSNKLTFWTKYKKIL